MYTNYGERIYSCLLIFPHNLNNFIITSSYHKSKDENNSATKIYSLDNGEFLQCINKTNTIIIFYLLSWYNKKNNNYYIIELGWDKIIAHNLDKIIRKDSKEEYFELIQSTEEEFSHLSGFIYNKDNNDYLCCSSVNGFIYIWDLYNKKINKIINTNNCYLTHIIEWNSKYLIVADYKNKSFKVIDIEEETIIDNIYNDKKIICIKKVYSQIYGESLLVANDNNNIILFTFD